MADARKIRGGFGATMFCGKEDELSVDDSHYSLTTGILPSLGRTRSNLSVAGLRSFVISPDNKFYRVYWETYLVVLVIYTAWAAPFEYGLLKKPVLLFSIIDNLVNLSFFIDIILTFFVAFVDKTTYTLVDDPKQIAWRYTRTWLVLDVISTIPSELAYKISPRNYGMFNMFRLWRLKRVSRFFKRLEKNINFSYFWVRLTKLTLVTFFVAHCAGSIFYRIAADNVDPSNTWIGLINPEFAKENLLYRYVISIYWAVTTLATVGYGDVHSNNMNTREMAFAACYMFFNFGFNAYLIGHMTNLIVQRTARTVQFRDTIQSMSRFAQRNQLPVRLIEQMLDNLRLKFRIDSECLQQQETIDSLPKAIRSSISHALFYPLLDNVYLFEGASKDLIFQLVSEMKAEYFPPNEEVILQNEVPTDFYIVVFGAVDFVVQKDGTEEIVGESKTGDLCGEIGVLCYIPQPFTVRTKKLSQLLRLNRTTFMNIIQANVGDGTIIMNNLVKHLTSLKEPIKNMVLLENMLARGRMDLPVSLSFAALRGDDLLLHQLLKRGLDANEYDSNGRTALHIAASKGSNNCALHLLDFKADPNSRDSNGSVPMWEAMLNGHESMINLLKDNGAKISSGDVGQFACTAAEKNSLNLLQAIVVHGGDITCPKSDGTTALHVAVCEANTEIVKFLLDHGADITKPDALGWSPVDLAEQQGHEKMIEMFQSKQETKPKSKASIAVSDSEFCLPRVPKCQAPRNTKESRGTCFLGKFKSEPTMLAMLKDDGQSPYVDGMWAPPPRRPRRRTNSFENSLFGVISAAQNGDTDMLVPITETTFSADGGGHRARLTISCPEKGDVKGKLVFLPKSLQELLEIGATKYGLLSAKVVTKDGAEIDDLELIRDGDHLIFANGMKQKNSIAK